MNTHICTACRSQFAPKRRNPTLGIVALCLAILPLLNVALGGGVYGAIIGGVSLVAGLYLILKSTNCPACGGTATIPLDTPVGRDLVKQKGP